MTAEFESHHALLNAQKLCRLQDILPQPTAKMPIC